MKRLATAATLAAIMLFPTAAAAQSITPYAGMDLDGNPLLSMSSSGVDFRAIHWRACPPGAGPCQELAGNAFVAPGPTAPGTVFEAYVLHNGAEVSARTPAWGEQVQSAGVPALSGELRVGGRVNVVPTSWTGGWDAAPRTEGAPRSGYAIAACSDTTGAQCFLIAEDKSVLDGFKLQPRWAGRHLLAGEWRGSGGFLAPAVGWLLPVPMTLERLRGGQPTPYGTALGTRGRLSELTGPVAADPKLENAQPAPNAPTVTLRSRALRSKGGISVGRITCAQTCKVAVKVSGGGKKAYTATLTAKPGVTVITAPVRRGKLTVRVHVDGKLIASGKVTAR